MCLAPKYMKGMIAAPLFDCTKEASRLETLCALATPGKNTPTTTRAIIIEMLIDNMVRLNVIRLNMISSLSPLRDRTSQESECYHWNLCAIRLPLESPLEQLSFGHFSARRR